MGATTFWLRPRVERRSTRFGTTTLKPTHVEIREIDVVRSMKVREVDDATERSRLWAIAVGVYPPYQEYQDKTDRQIPVFVAEPA
jgi:deazaflavin-dependent oxidoreductase (nitroreductase family)